ncbi:hypothetical protein L218DRAFT_1001601 [Marasmius fiardii PR-910]|nr:hypothetical protein L218DRAFT_1001601 [Marasmius fiardii PR-910]
MPNSRNRNEILNHASGVSIHSSSISNVGRDQYNHCTVQQTIVHTRHRKDKIGMHLPELSQFSEIKRGDIYKDSSGVCYSWRLCSNGKDDTEAAVYHAELNITGPFGQKKFTVKTYRGRNAKKEWRRDFLRCSEDWCRDIPLFGYNTSSVPLLIFCGELIPIACVQVPVGMTMYVMQLYFEGLRNTLDCPMNEIWMDPSNGEFCRGPAGPECWDWIDDLMGITIPANVDFLKENVLVRYLSSKKNDRSFLAALIYSNLEDGKNFRSNHPEIVSSLSSSTIAFRPNVRWMNYKGCFKEKKVVQGGLTRFCLNDGQRLLEVRSVGEAYAWLMQALSVFHAHGISFDEDLSQYKLVYPRLWLKGTLERSKFRQRFGPIYLFFEPCLSPDGRFYFWSHDPNGQDPLSRDMCKHLGLPFKLSLREVVYYEKTWPTKVYKALHDYQILRGFDPRTTDFAQSVGVIIWQVVLPENRFQELDQGIVDSFLGPASNNPRLWVEEQEFPSASEQLLPMPNNAPQHSLEGSGDDNHLEQLDDYSLEVLFDGNQEREFTFIQSSFNAVVGNSLAAYQVTKSVQLPKLFAPYARLLAAAAEQPSNQELLLDVD